MGDTDIISQNQPCISMIHTQGHVFSDKVTSLLIASHIAKFMGPTWGPPGFCQPQMGPMNLAIRDLSGLTHWGRVTHICVGKIIIIGSDNGLSPDRRQAIIWTNAGLLSIEPLWTYFSENSIKIQPFSLKKKCTWKCRLRNGVHLVSASMC